MSGRKQHFIPQSLLKGFGIPRGKVTQVVAYTRDRGVFTSATDGVGAERNFYSELSVEGETETLDDRITDYETPLATIIANLRALGDGDFADPLIAAELITHLIIRNDHFRKTATSAGADMINGVASAFADEDKARALLGLNRDAPSGVLAEQIGESLAPYRSLLPLLGLTEDQAIQWGFTEAKRRFSELHREMMEPIDSAVVQVLGDLSDIAANAQRKSLNEQLAPEIRVTALKELAWRVVHPAKPLVLPDCVAIGVDAAGASCPLMLIDLDQLETVCFPLSSDRLLVGSRSTPYALPAELNCIFARSSWDFFVARERTSELEQLRDILRSGVSLFLDGMIDSTLASEIEQRMKSE